MFLRLGKKITKIENLYEENSNQEYIFLEKYWKNLNIEKQMLIFKCYKKMSRIMIHVEKTNYLKNYIQTLLVITFIF